ncbi:MAG TPA: inositol 2-dehydrogenase [Candidatus Hydrogenedentes bacterium]|nr:inositol 2-dehydrogenase [Candidatus Hydrogenedentota bacterium]HOC71363.1 inositol 2-dehydrogenase [Candidatus Hydrogenedentota bacterium]HOH50793.1 inositol 2-dehydrogenase [Candidatus Hydrogenedentota bacterium]HQL93180.1 inositol 2-dehydrogenase [Candidatus Hydrogenedentota bacterium]HRZ83711.1 inositol 2-dehydrogenase [Candidatus Hydrogenedentota bacterium]
MDNRTLNIGLIGVGRIGKVHAEHLAYRIPRARLAAVSDVNLEAAAALGAKLGVGRVEADHRALLADPALDAVVICSPTDLHAPMIEESAAAGKHIFCEKPVARTLGEIDRSLDAVARAGVKLQIGFNRRFDANFARVRRAISSGEIGEPHLLHIVSRDPGPPPIEYVRVSGGMFLDMTIHDFDMARFLIGEEVEEVFAAGAVRVDPAIGAAGDLDTALVTLKFAGGALGVIDNSRRAVYGYDQRVEVLGSAGGAAVANNHPNTAVISDAASVHRDLPLNFFMDRYLDSFLTEMAAFVDAVLDGAPIPVTGEDGRAAVALGIAARRSHDENRPVRLDEIKA